MPEDEIKKLKVKEMIAMATNLCSRTRRKFSTVKELAEELNTSVQQIYRILKHPAMAESQIKIGKAGVRIDKDKFYQILEQIYR